jgi:rhodanese-related sulfurtransferase
MKAIFSRFGGFAPIGWFTLAFVLIARWVPRVVLLYLLCLIPTIRAVDAPAAGGAHARQQPAELKNVDVPEFEALRQEKKSVILDVRTPSEYAVGHIPGAVNIDCQAKDFVEKIAALDKGQSYLVHCAAGARSARACDKMAKLNFSNLYNLKDGFKAWQQAGMPVEKGALKSEKSVASAANTH